MYSSEFTGHFLFIYCQGVLVGEWREEKAANPVCKWEASEEVVVPISGAEQMWFQVLLQVIAHAQRT